MSKKYFLPTRRETLQTGAAAATAFWVTGSLPVMANSRFNIEKINFACIGVEGKGATDTESVSVEGNIYALCDCDETRLDKRASRYEGAKKFVDFREMIPALGDKVDAVVVSTPDHTHAAAASLAMKAGKHVYVQKPLTWSVNEARILRKYAKDYKVCTQMGNQGTAERGLREAVSIVRSGVLGKVTEVHVWTNRPVWPQGLGRPTEVKEVPKGLHWDLFLGPAPVRPYHPDYHPFKWRGFIDFGTGAIGDMACHTMNIPVMALDLFDPISVEATSTGIIENETFPKASSIVFDFAATEKRAACKMIWYDGGNLPGKEIVGDLELSKSGMLIVGTEAKLFSSNDYGAAYKLLPKEKFENYVKPEAVLPVSPGHYKEWAQAIAAGDPKLAISNFEYAARLTETALLGNVALRAGSKIVWDAATGKITNNEAANKYLGREYRQGWTL